MIATDFKLIPLAVLHKHEAAVLRGLDALPISYQENLLDEPEIRCVFLYFALLTHWPELLNGGVSAEELLYNRFYWFVRLAKLYQVDHDFEGGFERQATALLKMANRELGVDVVQEIDAKVAAELATNEWEIAVAFSNFSLVKVLTQFRLQLDETGDFFANIAPVPVSALLQETLSENTPLALAMGTEKARSELIIAPVLLEIRRQLRKTISLFSGVEWDIDSAQGLRGECDFLLCRSPHQLILQAPVVSVVEAKREDMKLGMGQCLAEMVAARIFNQQNHNAIPVVYGVVTTGIAWRFLRLVSDTAYVDVSEYNIKDVERIVGIIVSMFTNSGVPLAP